MLETSCVMSAFTSRLGTSEVGSYNTFVFLIFLQLVCRAGDKWIFQVGNFPCDAVADVSL